MYLLRAACAIKDQEEDIDGKEKTVPWFNRLKFVHFVKPNEFPEIHAFREHIE